MGQLLSEQFVAAHQQVGDFLIKNVRGEVIKNGGNVASYFCTPDGRVIHAVLGPVRAQQLHDEAIWALDAFRSVDHETPKRQAAHISAEHAKALQQRRSGQRRAIHQILARDPLPPLKKIYRTVFERVLGETFSAEDAVVEEAAGGIRRARTLGSPVVLIVHQEEQGRDGSNSVADRWKRETSRTSSHGHGNALAELAKCVVVVTVPQKDVPELSRHGFTDFQQDDDGTPLFVVARSTGERVGAVTTWYKMTDLNLLLARGLVEEAESQDSLGAFFGLAYCPLDAVHTDAGRILSRKNLAHVLPRDPSKLSWQSWRSRYDYAKELSDAKAKEIVAAFSDDDADKRWAAVGLAHLRKLAVPEDLVERLDDASDEVRRFARAALDTLAGEADAKVKSAATTALKRWQRGESFVREHADDDDAVVVNRFLREADPIRRWGAVYVARKRRLNVPYELIECLNDVDLNVRREAHKALVQLSGGEDRGPVEIDADETVWENAANRWTGYWQERREREAQREYGFALALLKSGKKADAKRRLQAIVAKYHETKSARDCGVLLATEFE